jgi:hypothetical protein
MPFGIGQKKRPIVREINPVLPGPWQYLSILTMFRAMEHRFRDLPPIAYPVIALTVWRAIQKERIAQRQALFDAEREAIRRSQKVYIARPKRKRFLFL